jgi:hypothetical protein
MDFFFPNLLNPSSRTADQGYTKPLTEISTRNFPLGKARLAAAAIFRPVTIRKLVHTLLTLEIGSINLLAQSTSYNTLFLIYIKYSPYNGQCLESYLYKIQYIKQYCNFTHFSIQISRLHAELISHFTFQGLY